MMEPILLVSNESNDEDWIISPSAWEDTESLSSSPTMAAAAAAVFTAAVKTNNSFIPVEGEYDKKNEDGTNSEDSTNSEDGDDYPNKNSYYNGIEDDVNCSCCKLFSFPCLQHINPTHTARDTACTKINNGIATIIKSLSNTTLNHDCGSSTTSNDSHLDDNHSLPSIDVEDHVHELQSLLYQQRKKSSNSNNSINTMIMDRKLDKDEDADRVGNMIEMTTFLSHHPSSKHTSSSLLVCPSSSYNRNHISLPMLPEDMQLLIYSYLDLDAWRSLMASCKSIRSLFRKPQTVQTLWIPYANQYFQWNIPTTTTTTPKDNDTTKQRHGFVPSLIVDDLQLPIAAATTIDDANSANNVNLSLLWSMGKVQPTEVDTSLFSVKVSNLSLRTRIRLRRAAIIGGAGRRLPTARARRRTTTTNNNNNADTAANDDTTQRRRRRTRPATTIAATNNDSTVSSSSSTANSAIVAAAIAAAAAATSSSPTADTAAAVSAFIAAAMVASARQNNINNRQQQRIREDAAAAEQQQQGQRQQQANGQQRNMEDDTDGDESDSEEEEEESQSLLLTSFQHPYDGEANDDEHNNIPTNKNLVEVVQYTGIVGVGDRCVRANQPLPRPTLCHYNNHSNTKKAKQLPNYRFATMTTTGSSSLSSSAAPYSKSSSIMLSSSPSSLAAALSYPYLFPYAMHSIHNQQEQNPLVSQQEGAEEENEESENNNFDNSYYYLNQEQQYQHNRSLLESLYRRAKAVVNTAVHGPTYWRPFVVPYRTKKSDVNTIHLTPRTISYFEITILPKKKNPDDNNNTSDNENNNNNNNNCIAIGIASNDFDMHSRMPGWDNSSYGYHSDDGGIFHGSGNMLKKYGPKFGVNDTVGCGINYSKQSIFYTLNGKFLGYSFQDISIDELSTTEYYPIVGIDTNDLIYCNFNGGVSDGGQPFVFDLTSMIVHEEQHPLE